MAIVRTQSARLLSRRARSHKFLSWCFPGRFLAQMEQSRLDTTAGLALRLCVTLFVSLGMWTAISLLICLSLPGAYKAIRSTPYRNADGLVTISSGGYSGAQSATIHLRDYESWKTGTRRLFTGIAFYQPVFKRVHIARHRGAELSIARASDNFFKVLNLPNPWGYSGSAERPIHGTTLFEPGGLAGAFWRRSSPDRECH